MSLVWFEYPNPNESETSGQFSAGTGVPRRGKLFMSANRTKLIVTVSLFLLCIFGCIGAKTMADVFKKNSEGQAPIRRLRITIDVSRREELFTQLQKFADKHAFEFLRRRAGPNYGGYFIRMVRADVYINAMITRVDPNIVSVGFYDQDPAKPIPKETIDDLFNDLKSFISGIPNVTIEEK
jgi:hypothetical protein